LEDKGNLLIETGVFLAEEHRAMLFCPIGKESPYEPSSVSFFNLKGLEDTLYTLGIVVQNAELLHEKDYQKKGWTHLLRKQPKMKIDRATLVCQMRADIIDSGLHNFWNALHDSY
jgi:hypothetical protein